MARDGMTEEGAREFYEYNILGAGIANGPVYMEEVEENEELPQYLHCCTDDMDFTLESLESPWPTGCPNCGENCWEKDCPSCDGQKKSVADTLGLGRLDDHKKEAITKINGLATFNDKQKTNKTKE